MMLRALESSERAHTLLTGPSASAKSLFMLEIEKFMPSKVYFAEGAATTKAGIQKFISENQDKEIIIIDEIDKMQRQHQEGLLTMMERGEFTSTKVRNTQLLKSHGITEEQIISLNHFLENNGYKNMKPNAYVSTR
jgi:DNA-binding NtrC family response regulator